MLSRVLVHVGAFVMVLVPVWLIIGLLMWATSGWDTAVTVMRGSAGGIVAFVLAVGAGEAIRLWRARP